MRPAVAAMRVLIVEDEPELGEVFQQYLVSRGLQADVVRTAEAALERLRTSRPHAIVLDVKLPGMSGLDFIRLQTVRDLGVPVIVVSGHANEEEARACLRLGALEFLAKPVPLEVLGTVLEHAELFAAPDDGPYGRDRRAARRVPMRLPLRVVDDKGHVASGLVVEASVTGLRAQVSGTLRTGAAVRLVIAMPDGGGPLDVIALVVRVDPDAVAVWFLDLARIDADRLLALATT